ncbi:hypothetical protein ACFO9E_18295 [Streptomyces maoxianensis]|uniref:Uncharacterized protein n=1 Tax=Streptomyces maoxianensis TaxID=1459942 RepID=A0ABV9G680_9ACTN
MSALDNLIVGYGPEQIQDITVHEDGVIETVVTKRVRVYERQADGSFLELHGEAKDHALDAFWAASDIFNQQQEQDS